MKKFFMILSLVLLVSMGSSIFAQEKISKPFLEKGLEPANWDGTLPTFKCVVPDWWFEANPKWGEKPLAETKEYLVSVGLIPEYSCLGWEIITIEKGMRVVCDEINTPRYWHGRLIFPLEDGFEASVPGSRYVPAGYTPGDHRLFLGGKISTAYLLKTGYSVKPLTECTPFYVSGSPVNGYMTFNKKVVAKGTRVVYDGDTPLFAEGCSNRLYPIEAWLKMVSPNYGGISRSEFDTLVNEVQGIKKDVSNLKKDLRSEVARLEEELKKKQDK